MFYFWYTLNFKTNQSVYGMTLCTTSISNQNVWVTFAKVIDDRSKQLARIW